MDLLNSDLGKQIISGVGQQVGTSEGETSSVLSQALPALLGAMQSNASNEQGAAGLLGALMGGKHGGLLENIGGILGDGKIDMADGAKILGHVLGGNQANMESNLSQNTGVSSDKIGMILKIAAPILMSFLTKKTAESNVSSGADLGGLLGGLLGGQATQQQAPAGGGNILTSLLDQDGDGQLGLGDAVQAVTKKGGLGGLLGSIFGKK